MPKRFLCVLLIASMSYGCAAPESAKRVTAHSVRDTQILLKENPDNPVALRAARATAAISGYVGLPEHPVHPEQLEEDILALERDSDWINRLLAALPGWVVKTGKVIGYVATGVALVMGGNYIGGARAIGHAVGVFTSAIEKDGSKDLKRNISKVTMGTKLGTAIDKSIIKFQSDSS